MKKALTVFSISLILLSACHLLNPEEERGFKDQNLQGKIRGNTFSFVSGVALDKNSSSWNIRLFPRDPAAGEDPWSTSAYSNVYPYLSFTISRTAPTQKYTVAFLSSSALTLAGWASPSEGTFFDDGEIEIQSIDTATITGRIWAITNEGDSINGNFSAVIEP